jgi:hypothetical protein
VFVSCFSAPGYIGTPNDAEVVLVPELFTVLLSDEHPASNANPAIVRTAAMTAAFLFIFSIPSGLLVHRCISLRRPSVM